MSRLCLVGPAAPFRGGISHYNSLLARALTDHHELLAVNFRRMYPRLLFPGRTQLDTSRAPLSIANQRVIDSLSPASWLRAGRQIRSFLPERVVFQWWNPFFAPSYRTIAEYLRRRAPTARRVFVCHNVLPHEPSPLDRQLAHVALAAGDAFLVHSTRERQVLERLIGDVPCEVHPHPRYDGLATAANRGQHVDQAAARAAIGVPQNAEVLLFFGYVRAYKGLRHAIEALALAARPNLHLVIAGEFYQPVADYRRLIDRHGVGERIVIHDHYIANEDLMRYFAAADVVVQPYVSATQSGVCQLAFAHQTPVIASAVGGVPEAIDNQVTGLLVPAGDSAALATAVARFFDQGLGPAMRRALARDRGASWTQLAEVITRV